MSVLVVALGAAAFGACIGSFLNVVVYRLPQADPQKRSLGGRSHCPSCGAQIQWRDNVPVLGWLMLRGRARCCRQPISVRYPLVEALVALLFAALVIWPPHPSVDVLGPLPLAEWSSAGHWALLFDAAFTSWLVASWLIARDHGSPPPGLARAFAILGASIVAFLAPGHAGSIEPQLGPELDSVLSAVLGAGCGYGAMWSLARLTPRAGPQRLVGPGEILLITAVGAFSGWQGVLLVLMLGIPLATVRAVFAASRRRTSAPVRSLGAPLALAALCCVFVQRPLSVAVFESWPVWARSSPTSAVLSVAAALSCVFVLWLLARRGRHR